MCYSCADEFERKRSNMADTRQFVAYISGDARNVTTWTGGQIMKITQHGMSRSGFHGSEIHYWRAVDDGGRQWYGRNGGPGMSVMMRRAGVKNRGY